MTGVYPAVVQSLRTFLNDNDLIDAVRDALHTIQFAITEAENAADDLETVIKGDESA